MKSIGNWWSWPNEILEKRTINNLKIWFFKSVTSEILPGKTKNSKIINIFVEEKATGKLWLVQVLVQMVRANVLVKNNYLGKV